MPTVPQEYPYQRLPVGNVFRYLILQPGAMDEALVASLHATAIPDIEYYAVSYVWGASTKDQTIVCDGHTMTITRNLAKVLRCVRSPEKPLVLWADSICINQEDKMEKAHQVKLMGKIYRCTERVLIYLGSDDDGEGPAVVSLLDDVDQMIQETCKTINMSWDSFPYLEDDNDLLRDARWDSLRSLLGQNWFDRGWVVQEAASAPYGEVIWGQSRFEWEKVMRTYIWLSTRGESIYHDKSFDEVQINAHTDVYLECHEEFLRPFYGQLAWGTNSLLRTLNCAKELDLSDPRDRIYAFMDLPQHTSEHLLIHPDYLTPYVDTYYRFAVEYIRFTMTTELLDYVCHNEASLADDYSWVPRWDVSTWSLTQSCSSLSALKPRNDFPIEPVIADSGTLTVQGVFVDTVQYISTLFDWASTTTETFKLLWDDVNAATIQDPYMSAHSPDSSRMDAFLDSLSAGLFDGEYSQWRKAHDLFAQELRNNHHHTNDHPGAEPTVAGAEEEPNVYFEAIRNRTHNRRFILTTRGYMGLAPSVVAVGDSCAIIFGCKTPCILRRTESARLYTYVGSTSLIGKEGTETEDDDIIFCTILGEEKSRDWVEWDVREQEIHLR